MIQGPPKWHQADKGQRPVAETDIAERIKAAAENGGEISHWLNRYHASALDLSHFAQCRFALGRQFGLVTGFICQPLITCFDEFLAAVQRISQLTERETEILRLIAEGYSNKEIGERLFVSSNTVKSHTGSIYRKLAVTKRNEAVDKAGQLGLL